MKSLYKYKELKKVINFKELNVKKINQPPPRMSPKKVFKTVSMREQSIELPDSKTILLNQI